MSSAPPMFSDELVAEVIGSAVSDGEKRIKRLVASLDAHEPGLGTKLLEQLVAEMRAGKVDALTIPHRLFRELDRRRRGSC